jgi:HK97 family phage portal protein
MDVMARILGAAEGGTPGPTSDFWYRSTGLRTEAGVMIDSETAKKLSAWYRGRDILASVLAMLPLQVFERLPDEGGARPAKAQPLYDLLHDTPNGWQDSFQWRRQKMYHLIDFGNGYDVIVPGPRGFVDQLWPIHPSLVTPKQLDSKRVAYGVKDPKTNTSRTYTQDEIFHLRGASDDGVVGKGILDYARSALGTAAATESYAANIFSNGTLNGGVIENPGVLNGDAAKRMAQSFVTASKQWHMPKVLEQGSKWVESTMTPEDAQMLLSRKYTVDDIARWLGVPRMMLENSDPSFGNAEQFTQNFIDFVMGPWLTLWENAIGHQLVVDPTRFFAQFKRQALVRGNFLERVNGLVAMTNAGIISVDEARGVEDLNKRGGKSDELRQPQNITGKPAVVDAAARRAAQPAEDSSSKAAAIASAAASRLLRKEIKAVQMAAVRHAADADAFVAAVAEFYAGHVELVMSTLSMSESTAKTYCAGQANQIVNAEWVQALDLWKTDAYAAGVAAIALEVAA